MTKPWLENHDLILGYYQKDGLPLNQVMAIMKEKHNFSASQRAYRQQFQKWRIFKYNRKSRNHYGDAHDPFHHQREDTPRYTHHLRQHRHSYPQAYSSVNRSPPPPAPGRLSLPAPFTTKYESSSQQYQMAHHIPYTYAHNPLPSPGSAISNVFTALPTSPDTKPTHMASPPDSVDSNRSLEHKPYNEADVSPYKSHYQSHSQTQPHQAEHYSHQSQSYYSLPTPQESSPSTFAPDAVHSNRYPAHSPSSSCQSSPIQAALPPYHHRDTAAASPYTHHVPHDSHAPYNYTAVMAH